MKKLLNKLDEFMVFLYRSCISAYAAQIAFFTIMSFIPLVILFVTITNYIPIINNAYIDILNDYIPNSIMPIINEVLNDLSGQTKAAVSISVIFTAWTSGKCIQAMTNGLNFVYGIEDIKPWILLRGKAVINTILYILIIAVMLFTVLFGNEVQEFIFRYIPGMASAGGLINNRFWIGFVFVTVSCLSFYKHLPSHHVTLKSQIPGALISGVASINLSYFLSIYVNRFNGFSMYGSITSLVLIMIWLYFIMYIILFGAAVNRYFRYMFYKNKEKDE